MERTLIAELRNSVGKQVKVQGFLQTLRDQKKMQFLILRDPTGLVQVAHYRPNNEELARPDLSAFGGIGADHHRHGGG